MKNSLVIDRDVYNKIKEFQFHGLSTMMMAWIDFYIIEEEDGSASFLKNRYNGSTSMTKEEYQQLKLSYMN